MDGQRKVREREQMERILIVIDMQNDFITGALGTEEARSVLPRVLAYVKRWTAERQGEIYFTRDTHHGNYLETQEGRELPVVHCLEGTEGWQLCPELTEYAEDCPVFDKPTFGSQDLAEYLQESGEEPEEIVLVGVCTDICVISNALLLKAFFPEARITVVADCCAGVTPESHERALAAMEACQVQVLRPE